MLRVKAGGDKEEGGRAGETFSTGLFTGIVPTDEGKGGIAIPKPPSPFYLDESKSK